jgi:hypothetical protein
VQDPAVETSLDVSEKQQADVKRSVRSSPDDRDGDLDSTVAEPQVGVKKPPSDGSFKLGPSSLSIGNKSECSFYTTSSPTRPLPLSSGE